MKSSSEALGVFALEDDAQVVGRHGDALDEPESVPAREVAHLVEIADAPFGVARAKAFIEGGVASRGVPSPFLEGPVEVEDAARRKQSPGARHQPLGGPPRRDVDHVDRNDRIGASDGPAWHGRIELERRLEVRQSGRAAMRRDAAQRRGVSVARLPGEMREAGGEVHGMLAGAACDLEHRAATRQHATKHREDRIAVARDGRRGEAALDHAGGRPTALPASALARFARASTTSKRTWHPASASSGSMLSASLWDRPSLQGVKIIAVGTWRAT